MVNCCNHTKMIINGRAIRNRLNCRVSSLDENVRKLKVLLCKKVVLLIKIALSGA